MLLVMPPGIGQALDAVLQLVIGNGAEFRQVSALAAAGLGIDDDIVCPLAERRALGIARERRIDDLPVGQLRIHQRLVDLPLRHQRLQLRVGLHHLDHFAGKPRQLPWFLCHFAFPSRKNRLVVGHHFLMQPIPAPRPRPGRRYATPWRRLPPKALASARPCRSQIDI